jgi:hypothetical protein
MSYINSIIKINLCRVQDLSHLCTISLAKHITLKNLREFVAQLNSTILKRLVYKIVLSEILALYYNKNKNIYYGVSVSTNECPCPES